MWGIALVAEHSLSLAFVCLAILMLAASITVTLIKIPDGESTSQSWKDPWRYRRTDLAYAAPDTYRSQSLILQVRWYELSTPWSSLARLSRARRLKTARSSARSAALFFLVHQKLCRCLSWRGRDENPPQKPNIRKSNPSTLRQMSLEPKKNSLYSFWFFYLSFWKKWITLQRKSVLLLLRIR